MNENPREPLGNPVRRNVFIDCSNQICSFDDNVGNLLDQLDIAENLAIDRTGSAKQADVDRFQNLVGTADHPLDRGTDDAVTPESLPLVQAWMRQQLPTFETNPLTRSACTKTNTATRYPSAGRRRTTDLFEPNCHGHG